MTKMKMSIKQKFLLGIFCLSQVFLLAPFFASADFQNDSRVFYVEKSYDLKQRIQVESVLKHISQKAYLYLEKDWYNDLSFEDQSRAIQDLQVLAREFDNVIYPKVRDVFGSEWEPGIDSDQRLTIFLHQMKEGAAGYFRTQDEFSILQAEKSNEREMLYVNIDFLSQDIIKSLLAHEFTHLIEFNQKQRQRGVEEDIWLSEMRAEIVPSLLGYNNDYSTSSLKRRVKTFIENPSDSLTQYSEAPADYGVLAVFGEYLFERYGTKIFTDSLQTPQKGTLALEEALKKSGSSKTLVQVFTDWLISVFINNCEISQDYCFKNQNLQGLKIAPSLIYLPSTQKTEFSLNYNTGFWAGNWYRIMGGNTELNVKFTGDIRADFNVPYVLCDKSQECFIYNLALDEKKQGVIYLTDFNKNWISLTLMPFVSSKTGLDTQKANFSFTIFAKSASANPVVSNEELISQLRAKIAEVQAKIAELQAQLAVLQNPGLVCAQFTSSLTFGSQGREVSCLQDFLKKQGQDIYPEGLITGFFGSLTQKAVARFQEKYADEILAPVGLESGNGYFGPLTRAKANELLR